MRIYNPKKDEAWQQFCNEIGGQFVDGGIWRENKVQSQVGPWTITLDTYSKKPGEPNFTETRIRAPFVNPGGFRFRIYRKSIVSGLGKLLGMQDIEVGDPTFDDAFIIQGTDEAKVRELFSDRRILELIQSQPRMRLRVKDHESWFGPKFPENVDSLHFQVPGVITDRDGLKSLFELFAAVLNRLCEIGSACREVPAVVL